MLAHLLLRAFTTWPWLPRTPAVSAAVVYLLMAVQPFKKSYLDHARDDTYKHLLYAVLPCAVVALAFNEGNFISWHGITRWLFEYLWAFSIYLEAIAILPQLILLQRHGIVENLTANYIVCLGAYRALYILNWVYR